MLVAYLLEWWLTGNAPVEEASTSLPYPSDPAYETGPLFFWAPAPSYADAYTIGVVCREQIERRQVMGRESDGL